MTSGRSFLTATEAAERLGVDVGWLLMHWQGLGIPVSDEGPAGTVFDVEEFEWWLASHDALTLLRETPR